MIRKIVSTIKKWASTISSRSPSQQTAHLGEREPQAQRDPGPNVEQASDPQELDENTTNEVVATWNLLNPP